MSGKYDSINKALFKRIPESARRILDVGCDTGLMGEALKSRNTDCYVVGTEINPETAKIAKTRLDEVYVLDIENDDLSIIEDNYDAILFGDVIEHLYDPEKCLDRLRHTLAPGGKIYACIPNIQHYSALQRILRGDFQYQKTGLFDRTHIRFFTLANIMKLFLDGGFIPKKIGRLVSDPNPFSNALAEVIKKFNYSKLNIENLNTFQYLFEASPMLPLEYEAPSPPISFVVCSNNNAVLNDNLKASPIFRRPKHQLIIKRNVASAAEGYNAGLEESTNDIVVFAHQDVYLPYGWDQRLFQQVKQIENMGTTSWIYGCIGFGPSSSGGRAISGVVVDRDTCLNYAATAMPEEVQTLDELALVVPKNTRIKFDPSLEFHLYGADICMQNASFGGKNYAGYTPCVHNSQLFGSRTPEGFNKIASTFSKKWSHIPNIVTSCKIFEH